MTSSEPRSMHIGEVAARTGLSHRTMRHWEEAGLVIPSGRTDGGFRLYTEQDVERVLLIRRMKPLGFTIDEMKRLLDAVDSLGSDRQDGAARLAVQTFIADAEERRERLVRQLGMADEFLRLLRSL